MRPLRAPRGWDLATLGILAAMVVAHVRFAAVDQRTLLDQNLCFAGLPGIHAALAWPPRVGFLFEQLATTSAGWYGLLLAATMRLTGLRQPVFEVFLLVWMVLALGCGTLLSRRLWGPRGGFCGACLLASSWLIAGAARTTWIHVPELAPLLGALYLLLRDPALRRPASAFGVAVLGAAALSLRPSGIIWIATLLPLLRVLVPFPGPQARRRRAAVGLAWLAGLVPTVWQLPEYLGTKLEMYARYTHLTGFRPIQEHLANTFGRGIGAVTLLGLLLLPLALRGRRAVPAGVWLLAAWVGIALGLALGFRAGLDNFPEITVALAALAAGGLARGGWVTALLPALPLAWLHAGQYLPSSSPLARALPGFLDLGRAFDDHPGNFFRPLRDPPLAEVLQALDAVCGQRTRCALLVDHNVFHPFGEEPGALDLFLVGREDVEAVALYHTGRLPDLANADGWVSRRCDADEQTWQGRHPGLDRIVQELVASHRFTVVWERPDRAGCSSTWHLRTADPAGGAPHEAR